MRRARGHGPFQALALAPSAGTDLALYASAGPGITAEVFFGFRSFNDISHFEALAGVRLDGRWGFGPSADRAVTLAVQLDLTSGVAFFAAGGS